MFTSFIACTSNQESKKTSSDHKEIIDPLPSWNDVKSKQNIIAYVEDVTNENSLNFIPISERISTFDNDGNLWAEQPYYFQLQFGILSYFYFGQNRQTS